MFISQCISTQKIREINIIPYTKIRNENQALLYENKNLISKFNKQSVENVYKCNRYFVS